MGKQLKPQSIRIYRPLSNPGKKNSSTPPQSILGRELYRRGHYHFIKVHRKMKKRGRSVLFTDAFYPLALTYWTHRSQIWKVMRSLYNLLERVFDRVNRDGGVCGQVTHSRYETEQYRYSLYMPVTVPSDGFFSFRRFVLYLCRQNGKVCDFSCL